MLDCLATEIRSFYSLKDLRESIEKEIDQHKAVVDEYSQWLGSFLRDMEATHGNEDWFKRLAINQKTAKRKARKESEKEGRGKKKKTGGTSAAWFSYKDVMLGAGEQGEAEILFDAVEEINRKIEHLSKVRSTIENLERSNLGKDIIYVTYIHDGVPEKIVLRHKKEKEFAEKFKFMADFSMLKEVYP